MLWNYIWVRREKNISSEQITSFDGHICCHSCNQQPTHAELCSNAHKPFNMLRKHCCSLMHSHSESSDWWAEPKGRELTMQLATHKQCSEWSFPIINSCCAVVERLTIVTLMLKNRPFLIYLFFPSKNYSEHQERSLFSKYKPGHFITIPHNLKFETIDNLSVKLNDY